MKFFSVLFSALCSLSVYAQTEKIEKPENKSWITCNEKIDRTIYAVNRPPHNETPVVNNFIEKCTVINLNYIISIYTESDKTIIKTFEEDVYSCVSLLPGCQCNNLNCALFEKSESE